MNRDMTRTSRESRTQGTLVALLALAMVVPTVGTWMSFYVLDGAPVWLQQVGYVIAKSVMLVPLLWFLLGEGGRLRVVRPTGHGIPSGLAFGILVALGMFALYYGWLKPAGLLEFAQSAIRERVAGFGIDTFVGFLLFGVFVSLIHSALEEYYWRWFVFGRSRRLMSTNSAVVLASVMFTSHHVVLLGKYFGWFSLPQILFSLAVGVGGAVWCKLYDRSRSLYGPWLSHLIVDAAIFVVGYDLAFL